MERELMLLKINADPKYRAEVSYSFVSFYLFYSCLGVLYTFVQPFPCACVAQQLNYFLCVHFQVMWLVDIFRAKIVDISDHSLTIEVMSISLRFTFCIVGF